MKPEDMSKKRFKLIPGEDYSNGPISEHGTFGNMLKTKMVKGLKASADNIPMGPPTDEQMMNITDFVNPVRGMVKAVAKGLTPKDKEILLGWGEGGSYQWKDSLEEAKLIEVLEKQPRVPAGRVTRHGNINLDFGDFNIGDILTSDRLLSAEKKGGNYQGRFDAEGRTNIDTEGGGVYDFENYQLPSANLEKEVLIPKNSRLEVTNFTPKGSTKTREFIPGFKEEYTTIEDILELRLLND